MGDIQGVPAEGMNGSYRGVCDLLLTPYVALPARRGRFCPIQPHFTGFRALVRLAYTLQ